MNVNNFYLKVKRVIKEKRLFITLYQIIRDKTIRKILPYFRNKQMHENLNKFYSIKINNKDLKLIYTKLK